MTIQVIDEEVYILAPIRVVWDALTNADMTEKYWGGTRIESDWKTGSTIVYRRNGEITDEHELLELVPQRLIEHTFKPLFGEFKDEPSSLVSIILSEEGSATRINVLHRRFPPLSRVYTACRSGWPEILRSLKDLLEGEKYS